MLTELYGLTDREAELAPLLVQGQPLGRVAYQLNIAEGTARLHLERIMQKTDTHRQVDLARLILASCPVV